MCDVCSIRSHVHLCLYGDLCSAQCLHRHAMHATPLLKHKLRGVRLSLITYYNTLRDQILQWHRSGHKLSCHATAALVLRHCRDMIQRCLLWLLYNLCQSSASLSFQQLRHIHYVSVLCRAWLGNDGRNALSSCRKLSSQRQHIQFATEGIAQSYLTRVLIRLQDALGAEERECSMTMTPA